MRLVSELRLDCARFLSRRAVSTAWLVLIARILGSAAGMIRHGARSLWVSEIASEAASRSRWNFLPALLSSGRSCQAVSGSDSSPAARFFCSFLHRLNHNLNIYTPSSKYGRAIGREEMLSIWKI